MHMYELVGAVLVFLGFAVMGYFWTSDKDVLILIGAVFGSTGIALVLLELYMRIRGEKTRHGKSKIGRWNI
jgi:hypothetical protein